MTKGEMDTRFRVVYTKFWPDHLNVAAEIETHRTKQNFSVLLSEFAGPVHIVA